MKINLLIALLLVLLTPGLAQHPLTPADPVNTPEQAKAVMDYWTNLGGKKERYDALPAADWQILFEKAVQHATGQTKTDAEVTLAVLYHAQTNFTRARPLLEKLHTQKEKLSNEQLSAVLIRLEEEYRSAGMMDHAVRIRNERIEKGFIKTFWELYKDCGLYQEAILDFKQFEPMPSKPGAPQIKYFLNLSNLFFENQQTDSALFILNQALVVAKKLQPGPPPEQFDTLSLRYFTGNIQGNIARCLMRQQKFREAIPKLQYDIDGSKGSPDNIHLKSILQATCYMEIGDNNKAGTILTKVIGNLNGRSDHISFKLIYPLLSRYYEIQQLSDSALKYARLDKLLTDSLNGTLIQNQSLLLLSKMEIEKRRNELVKTTSELNQSKRIAALRNLLLLILALVIALLLTILYLKDRHNKAVRRSQLDIARQNLQLEEKNLKIERQNQYQNMLLRELHHRVKNNLQVLSSMVSMQKRRTRDDHTVDILSVLQSRIMAMSFVHESLHLHEQQLSSPAGHFICTFVRHIQTLNSGSRSADVSCETDEHILLPADKVICLSLIINEAITNSFKYAQTSALSISLKLYSIQERIHLDIRDNGAAEPTQDFMDKGMGMKIIVAMCGKLQATHTVTYENGLSHHIEFNS